MKKAIATFAAGAQVDRRVTGADGERCLAANGVGLLPVLRARLCGDE